MGVEALVGHFLRLPFQFFFSKADPNLIFSRMSDPGQLQLDIQLQCYNCDTVCPKSLDPIYVVTYFLKVKISWTYSKWHTVPKSIHWFGNFQRYLSIFGKFHLY